MEFNKFRFFFFILFICVEFGSISCHTYLKNSQNSYDGGQSYQRIQENIEDSYEPEVAKDALIHSGILDDIQKINFYDLLPLLLKVIDSASNNSCVRDLAHVAQNINLKDPLNSWALKMIDSFGKPESSFLEGNMKWLGDFNECRSVYAPRQEQDNTGGFHGQYCLLQVRVAIITLSVGVCLPETCNPADFTANNFKLKLLSQLYPALKNIATIAQALSVTCKANTRQLSGAAIATIFVISIFVLVVLLGSSITAFKYFEGTSQQEPLIGNEDAGHAMVVINEEKNTVLEDSGNPTKSNPKENPTFFEKCEPYLNCFCIFTNASKLMDTNATEGQMLSLHGFRFLSMTWIILCHTYVFTTTIIRNLKGIEGIDNLPFQVVINGFYAVDSFFFLSGFLMACLYFKEADLKEGFIPWIYFYIHRYIRLTPVYMIVLVIYTTLLPYASSGPFWPDHDIEPLCQKSWWWNLLYINNFQRSTEQCMPWTWYLATDMQLFAISPLFLITLYKWPKIGYSVLASFLCGSWIISFVLTYHYDLVAGGFGDVKVFMDPSFIERWHDYFDIVYIKPYTRIGAYLVGIALAYFLFKTKISHTKVNRWTLIIGWVLSTIVGLACVFGLYHSNPNVIAASFYNSISRTCYAVCLAWLIFVCVSGQGGAVDKILSCKLFIPLSRVSYCAYLLHSIVINGYAFSSKTTLDFSHFTMVTLFFGVMVITYALSFLASVMFESPVIRLEKLVRRKF